MYQLKSKFNLMNIPVYVSSGFKYEMDTSVDTHQVIIRYHD